LIRILLSLKSRANSRGVPAQFSWNAISNMLQNVSGTQMDYETFKAEFDQLPQLKNIVAQFDGRSNDAAASRAAAKTLKQPG